MRMRWCPRVPGLTPPHSNTRTPRWSQWLVTRCDIPTFSVDINQSPGNLKVFPIFDLELEPSTSYSFFPSFNPKTVIKGVDRYPMFSFRQFFHKPFYVVNIVKLMLYYIVQCSFYVISHIILYNSVLLYIFYFIFTLFILLYYVVINLVILN